MATVTGKFKHGIKIGEAVYTDFELREAITEDLMSAELEAANFGGGVHTPVLFNAVLMTLQLVRVFNDAGDKFEGVVTLNMIKGLKPVDYRALRTKQEALDKLGEGE